MAIEHIGATPIQNNIKTTEIKFNAPPLEKKDVKENGNKLLYASLAGLATFAITAIAIYKLKAHSSLRKFYPQGIPYEENGIKYFFKNGKLYNEQGELSTAVLNRVSSSGHKLETHYKDGEVVKRLFKPAKDSNSNIEYISKKYITLPGENTLIEEEIAKYGESPEFYIRMKIGDQITSADI